MDEKFIVEKEINDYLGSGTSVKTELFNDEENQRKKVVLFHVFNPESGLYEKKYLNKIKKKINKKSIKKLYKLKKQIFQ